MKFIPPALLVGFALFSAYIGEAITSAHSIILFSLAGLFAWNQWLLSRSTPRLEDEILKLRNELSTQMEQQKELHAAKIASLEGELTKISLSAVRSSSSPSRPEKKQYHF